MATTAPTLSETLRPLYLFGTFTDEQLAWVATAGEVVTAGAGTPIITEGAPADAFYVLLDGTIRLTKRVGRAEADVGTSSQPGAWFGYFPIAGNNAHVLWPAP